MRDRTAQAPSGDEPIRNIVRAGTSRSVPKRKDRALSPPEAGAERTADDVKLRIEKLAYALYQQRGQQDVYDCEDWLEAERMVQASSAAHSRNGSGHSGTSPLHSA